MNGLQTLLSNADNEVELGGSSHAVLETTPATAIATDTRANNRRLSNNRRNLEGSRKSPEILSINEDDSVTTTAEREEVAEVDFDRGADNPLQHFTDNAGGFLASNRPSTISRTNILNNNAVSVTTGFLNGVFGRCRSRLDLGSDLDPIDRGLISMEEADALFT